MAASAVASTQQGRASVCDREKIISSQAHHKLLTDNSLRQLKSAHCPKHIPCLSRSQRQMEIPMRTESIHDGVQHFLEHVTRDLPRFCYPVGSDLAPLPSINPSGQAICQPSVVLPRAV